MSTYNLLIRAQKKDIFKLLYIMIPLVAVCQDMYLNPGSIAVLAVYIQDCSDQCIHQVNNVFPAYIYDREHILVTPFQTTGIKYR